MERGGKEKGNEEREKINKNKTPRRFWARHLT